MDDSYYEGTISETEDFSPYPLEGEMDGSPDSDSGSAWTDTVIDYRPQHHNFQPRCNLCLGSNHCFPATQYDISSPRHSVGRDRSIFGQSFLF